MRISDWSSDVCSSDLRAAAAERYFASQAERWDAIRSLHISENEVEAAIQRALAGRDIGRLVDVGTGTGRMIELFAGRATEVSGIDRSAEMLRLARAKLESGRASCRERVCQYG